MQTYFSDSNIKENVNLRKLLVIASIEQTNEQVCSSILKSIKR